ncbi:RNA-dependent RNA polymerase [Entomophthora muscae mitovirus 1]|uniref:RNA-dependent RNA polymerase n=1 Tax=Entomophthora muscae mitovirus 1 TaxID=2557974 RepID=A0A4D6PCX0_9VIRU|nr:RNA-dependent RNA polymerase [Entomophthora muscae mitovirus 1]QCF24445.1 RNA-dependent RNA polymerase [Entomophthora muscae mitovirus 1]QCF24452.1 RNA-dependent RNA polymerase [Entomophthora muscae mitovirus 1]QCF24460.1 RNA-dependent RNA polymerase [Entomophthora muscae mitovirus 1]
MKSKQQLLILVGWVIRWYFSSVPESRNAYRYWKHLWARYEESRGLEWTVKRFKLIRLCVTRYISGKPHYPTDVTIGMTKDGLPKALGPLKSLVRSRDVQSLRLVLTLLYVGRAFRPSTLNPDLRSITTPSSANPELIEDIYQFAKNSRVDLHLSSIDTDFRAFHFTEKAGPSGHGLLASYNDYYNLTEDLKQDLLLISNQTIGEHFNNVENTHPTLLDHFRTNWVKKTEDGQLSPFRSKLIRVISLKPDREYKTRPFALLDYWSQTCLKPIHDKIFGILKQYGKTDCTFGHNEAMNIASNIPNPDGSQFHSLDLSSATDRFPMDLQVKILSLMIGEDKAEAWRRILVSKEYTVLSTGARVRYLAGQPMGAYSSWAMFTLCHHIVVRYAARNAKFDRYTIIGDDIVIRNDNVAERYKNIVNQLGVTISEAKSHVSPDTFEIAKKWYYRGKEITPFPIDGMEKIWKSYDLLFLFLLDLKRNKGLEPRFGVESLAMIRSLWSRLGKPPRLVRSVCNGYRRFAAFPFFGEKDADYKDPRGFLESVNFPSAGLMSQESAKALITSVTAGQLTNSLVNQLFTYQMDINTITKRAYESVSILGYGPFAEGLEDKTIDNHPFFASQKAMVKDSLSILTEAKESASKNNFDDIINMKPLIFLSNPTARLSGDREVEILGSQAVLVHSAVAALKGIMLIRELVLTNEEDSQTEQWVLRRYTDDFNIVRKLENVLKNFIFDDVLPRAKFKAFMKDFKSRSRVKSLLDD